MRRFIMVPFILFSLAVFGFFSPVKAGDLSLELRSKSKAGWVGSPVPIELVLRGKKIAGMVSGTEGLLSSKEKNVFSAQKPNRQFIYSFQIKPVKAGTLVLGPYELEVMGQKLRSNQLTVTVKAKASGSRTIKLSVDKRSVKVGQPFQLTLASESDISHQLSLKENPRFQKKSDSTSQEVDIKDGQMTQHFSRTFEIMPLKKGTLRLGRNSLEGVPAGAKVGEVIVKVK